MAKMVAQSMTHPVIIIALCAVAMAAFPSETLAALKYILQGWSYVQG